MNGYKNEASVYTNQANALSEQTGNTTIQLVQEGKKLENNEENYASFIKFVKTAFSVTALSALNFVAFILVNAFEVLFHFIGVRTGVLKEALLRSGYNFTPEPPTPEDVNAKIKYKREIRRAKWTEKTRNYARKLEKKSRKNRNHLPTPSDNFQNETGKPETVPDTVPETVPTDRTGKKKRKHTPLTDDHDTDKQNGNRTDTQGKGTPNNPVKPVDRSDQMRAEGVNKAWFPKIVYLAVREAILAQRIKPTVRPTHTVVSEGLKEGLYDEKGKHRHYTKPETQEITVYILEKLEEETVILRNTEGGVGKAKYVLNMEHPEVKK